MLHNYPDALRRLDKRSDGDVVIDLAAVDILRDRERGIPRYCKFPAAARDVRSAKLRRVSRTIPDWRKEIKTGSHKSVEDVDFPTGTLAESKAKTGTPPGFGFSGYGLSASSSPWPRAG